MNTLFVGAAHARRRGDSPLAATRCREAQAIACACGAERIRKIPQPLPQEALAASA